MAFVQPAGAIEFPSSSRANSSIASPDGRNRRTSAQGNRSYARNQQSLHPPGDRTKDSRSNQQAFRAGRNQPDNAPTDSVNQLEAKVVILGSQGVGKTSIVHRYTSGVFSRSLSSTLGASFFTKRLIVDGVKVRLQLWDTAGQERFRSMAPLYYRGALAAILVYDITSMASFLDIKMWLDELRREMSPDLIIHVVGSKADLAPTKREVDLQYAQRAVAEWILEGLDEEDRSLSSRDHSPSSRRKNTIRGNSAGESASGSMTSPTSPSQSSAPSSLGARVRKMSTQLMSPPLTLTSPAQESSPELPSRVPGRLSLSLGLGMNSTRGRRSNEETRKSAEKIEEERIEEMIRECQVEVTEASAEDDYGIEEVFLQITNRLVERKSQIESDRLLRSRDSIVLHDETPDAVDPSWCC